METISQYISPEYAILIAVLYCIGCGLKTLRRFPNQFIPLSLTLAGILLAALSALSRHTEFANWAALAFECVVQGVLSAGMAVYVHELATHCGPGGCVCPKDDPPPKD